MSRATLTSLLAVALTAAVAVGCSSEQPESAAPPAPPAASQPAPRPDAKPSANEAPAATESPTASAGPRHDGRHKVGALAPNPRTRAKSDTAAHLLGADDLPALAGDWTAKTAVADPKVGACQKTGLGTIGAVESAQRTYAADGATAILVVARFVDRRSAWRAHEVLEAWRNDCATRLGDPGTSIGPLEDVWVPVGTGASYRSAYGKRTAGLGILRTGEYLTVVEITGDPGQYPANWEPVRVAIRKIARTFEVS